MSFKEKSAFCSYCNRQVLVRKQTPNHVLHALIALFTCGLWLVIWGLIGAKKAGDSWLCTMCGNLTDKQNAYQANLLRQQPSNVSGTFGQGTSGSNSNLKIAAYIIIAVFGVFGVIGLTLLSVASNVTRTTNQSNVTAQSNNALPTSTPLTPQTMYAIKEAPMYTEADTKSKRVKRPKAVAPMTISMNAEVKVLSQQKGWYKVEKYDDVGWVEAKFLAASLPEKNLQAIYKLRLEGFNRLQSTGEFKSLYAGTKQNGDNLTFLVKDTWHIVSDDIKLAFINQSLTLWAGMGGAQGLKEDINNLNVEVIHAASGRELATWDGLWGAQLH